MICLRLVPSHYSCPTHALPRLLARTARLECIPGTERRHF